MQKKSYSLKSVPIHQTSQWLTAAPMIRPVISLATPTKCQSLAWHAYPSEHASQPRIPSSGVVRTSAFHGASETSITALCRQDPGSHSISL